MNNTKLAIAKYNYELLRQYYIDELQFMIPLLNDAETMNKYSVAIKGRPFLEWSDEHSKALRDIEELLVYLKVNKYTWDYKHVFEVINSLPQADNFELVKKLTK